MLLYPTEYSVRLDIFVYGSVQLCLEYPNGKGNMEISLITLETPKNASILKSLITCQLNWSHFRAIRRVLTFV